MVNKLRPERGGFLRPFHTGIFIRDYLLGKGSDYGVKAIDPRRGAPIDDIRAAYKNALFREYAEDWVARKMEEGITVSVEEGLRRIPQRLTKMRASSFYRYFHHLKMLGWVEPTGEEEGSLTGGMPGARVERTPRGTTLVEVPQPRRFYRLTDKGKTASFTDWTDPLQAYYHYPHEQRSHKKPELYRKPGSVPRSARRSR